MTDFTWDAGGDGTTWEDPLNWEQGASPRTAYPDDNGDKAIFPTGESASLTTAGALTIGELDMQAGFTGSIALGGKLTVDDAGVHNGNITVTGGTLDLADQDIDVDGAFTVGASGAIDEGPGAGPSTATMRGDCKIAIGATVTAGQCTWDMVETSEIENNGLGQLVYKLKCSAAGKATTLSDAFYCKLGEFGTGTLTAKAVSDEVYMRPGASVKALTNAGVTTDASGGAYPRVTIVQNSYSVTMDGGSYGGGVQGLRISGSGTVTLVTRNVSCGQLEFYTGTFDLNGFDLAVETDIDLGLGGSAATLQGGASSISCDRMIFLNAGSVLVSTGAITVSGSWNNAIGGTMTLTGSTVTFDAGSGTENIDSGGESFGSVVFDGAATFEPQDAFVCSGNLTIIGSANFDLNGQTLSVGGDMTIGGAFAAGTFTPAASAVSVGGDFGFGNQGQALTASGAWTIGGGWLNGIGISQTMTGSTVTFNASSGSHNIGLGGETFDNVVFNDGGGGATWLAGGDFLCSGTFLLTDGTFDTNNDDAALGGNFTQNGGVFNCRANTINFGGDVIIAGGTFSATNALILVNGDWNSTGGTLSMGTATVSFNGTGTQTITSGGEEIPRITNVNTGGKIYFADAVDTRLLTMAALTADRTAEFEELLAHVVDEFTLSGISPYRPILQSSNPGTQWQVTGTINKSATRAQVTDSSLLGAIVTVTNGVDGGNNSANWVFAGERGDTFRRRTQPRSHFGLGIGIGG